MFYVLMPCFVSVRTFTEIRGLWLCTYIYGQNLEGVLYFYSFLISFDVLST